MHKLTKQVGILSAVNVHEENSSAVVVVCKSSLPLS